MKIKKTISNTFIIACFIAFNNLLFCCSGQNQIKQHEYSYYIQQVANNNFIKEMNGFWQCYKYIKDSRDTNEEYCEEYAKEFSKYTFFELKHDTLKGVGIYNTPVYSYSYPVKFHKYDNESVFITYFQPKDVDSLIFVSPYNSYEYYWENSNNAPAYIDAPLNRIYCYYKNDFIIHDRGYFFFFKQGYVNNSGIYGVSGDNRNRFTVNKNYSEMNVSEAYKTFKQEFPYGGKNLIEKFSKEIFFDSINSIMYEWENATWRIAKQDPLGSIVISFEQKKSDIILKYTIEYVSHD